MTSKKGLFVSSTLGFLLFSFLNFLFAASAFAGCWIVNANNSQSQQNGVQVNQGVTVKLTLDRVKTDLLQSKNISKFISEIRQVSKTFANDPLAHLNAMETLADSLHAIASESTNSKSLELSDLATEMAQLIVQSNFLNGSNDVEIGFRAASVLRALGDRFSIVEPQASAVLFLNCGRISRNLFQNSNFPIPARSGLAPLLLQEAKGYVLNKDDAAALKTVQESLQWGLVEFQAVLDEPLLKSSTVSEQVAAEVSARRAAYCKQITPGIQGAMANFTSFEFNFSAIDVRQNRFNKSHFAGDYLVVDLWGTWCAPCRAEIPHLNHLQKQFVGKHLKVVGVAIEQGDTEEQNRKTLKSFLDENEVGYQCLVGNDELTRQLPNFKSYPTLLFIDKQGTVRFASSGYLDYTQMEVIVEQLMNRQMVSTRAN